MYKTIKILRNTYLVCYFDEQKNKFHENVQFIFNNKKQAEQKVKELSAAADLWGIRVKYDNFGGSADKWDWLTSWRSA